MTLFYGDPSDDYTLASQEPDVTPPDPTDHACDCDAFMPDGSCEACWLDK